MEIKIIWVCDPLDHLKSKETWHKIIGCHHCFLVDKRDINTYRVG